MGDLLPEDSTEAANKTGPQQTKERSVTTSKSEEVMEEKKKNSKPIAQISGSLYYNILQILPERHVCRLLYWVSAMQVWPLVSWP